MSPTHRRRRRGRTAIPTGKTTLTHLQVGYGILGNFPVCGRRIERHSARPVSDAQVGQNVAGRLVTAPEHQLGGYPGPRRTGPGSTCPGSVPDAEPISDPGRRCIRNRLGCAWTAEGRWRAPRQRSSRRRTGRRSCVLPGGATRRRDRFRTTTDSNESKNSQLEASKRQPGRDG